MRASPLLVGNDLRKMSDQTLAMLTNEGMIAINQDPLVYQARRLQDNGVPKCSPTTNVDYER